MSGIFKPFKKKSKLQINYGYLQIENKFAGIIVINYNIIPLFHYYMITIVISKAFIVEKEKEIHHL